MSGKKCKHCGSSEIEVDPGRGDAVCTNCGTVLEDNIIVAEVEFQENTHGGASAIGQFVSAESKGGATGFGGAFNAGIGQESREITIRKARQGIIALCQQLRLNQQCIEIACNFFKMALCRSLTKGRPASHIHAACVYITCRTEGTAHLLIDISDALQICCYQLGRTYLRLSRALCINIPSIDPCIYILRFASQLQFGDKKHEVTQTALRLVQRMKRDSIHSGRRPSGLCGAALLIAARLHEFSRSPADVVRIVKVHESTLRKRLLEFGDTPSSALTLEEFHTVDLEEEQDPPAFRAARRRDKERLQKLIEEDGGETELTQLQKEIDIQLENDNARRKKVISSQLIDSKEATPTGNSSEDVEAALFTAQDTLDIIGEITQDIAPETSTSNKGLGPDLAMMGLNQPEDLKTEKFLKPEPKVGINKDLQKEELHLSDKDEAYINTLIMSKAEVEYKTKLWHRLNAGYLKEQKIKEELRAKEREEGKDKKKKTRGSYKKRGGPSATAGEAIEKMLLERKISSKINYDILRSLDSGVPGTPGPVDASKSGEDAVETKTPVSETNANKRKSSMSSPGQPIVLNSPIPTKRNRKKAVPTLALPSPVTPKRTPTRDVPVTPIRVTPSTPAPAEPAESADPDGDYDEELEAEGPDAGNEMESLAAMLHSNQEEDYDEYEEY